MSMPPVKSAFESVPREKRIRHITVAAYRALYDVGEEGHEESEAPEALFSLDRAAENVHEIADCHKGIVRYSERHSDSYEAELCSEKSVDVRNGKIRVLDRGEYAEIEKQAEREPQLSLSLLPLAESLLFFLTELSLVRLYVFRLSLEIFAYDKSGRPYRYGGYGDIDKELRAGKKVEYEAADEKKRRSQLFRREVVEKKQNG